MLPQLLTPLLRDASKLLGGFSKAAVWLLWGFPMNAAVTYPLAKGGKSLSDRGIF